MPDLGTTVIVDLQLNQQDYKQKAIEATNQIIALKDKQDLLRASGQQLGVTYATVTQQISQLTQQQKAYITLSQNQLTSDNAKAAQLKLLTNQYKTLSDAEKTNTTQGQLLTAQTAKLKQELNDSGAAIKNFTGQVGSYTEGINKSNVGQQKFSQGITQLVAQNVPYGNSLINLVQGTNSLGGAFEGASLGAAGFVAAGAAIVAITAGIITHFAELTPNANKLSQAMAGVKGYFRAFVDDIGTGASFDKLADDMIKVSSTARELSKELQDLGRTFEVLAVRNAEFDTKIADLQLQLRKAIIDKNAGLQNEVFGQIQSFNNKRYELNKAALLKEYELQVGVATNTERFNDADVNGLLRVSKKTGIPDANTIQRAADLSAKKGFVNGDEDLSKLKDIAVQLQNNEKLRITTEERNEDRLERAKVAAERRAEELKQHLQAIQQDLIKSQLLTAEATLTIREKEYAQINADIDKRKLLYIKYGQDTTQIERERLSRIQALDAQFRAEDLQTIGTNLQQARLSQAKTGKNNFTDKNATVNENTAALNNQDALDALDKEIAQVVARVALGETNLGDVLDSFIQKRQSKEKENNQTLGELINQRYQNIIKTATEASKEQIALDNKTLENEAANQQARLRLNDELVGSYENLFGTIADMANKNSIVSKVAFGIEKALAIARIIINAEIQKSEIATAAATQAAEYATIPVFGIGLAAAAYLAAAVKEAEITTQEVVSVGVIAAQTIATEVQGRAKGGLITGPGNGTSDSIPARLSNGEAVMTANAVKMFSPILSEMNVVGGGVPFANGGLAGSYVPNLSQQAQGSNIISRSLMASISKIKPTVYVEDINTGIHQMNVNVEAANF